ncbi:MAG: thioredoxin [Alloprevotella sp.]|nr:thioredoxin [Alloprevotella sp.]
MEKIITDANFQNELAAGLPLVVDFSATWCGPCRRVAPIIEELAKEYEGRVTVGKCDVDENENLCAQFGVRNVPTILFIKDGQVVDKVVGAAPKADFVKKIEALL